MRATRSAPPGRVLTRAARRSVFSAILAVTSALVFAGDGFAQISAFHFHQERVPVGRVFHYLKTNLDGSNPERVALYVAGRDRIEAFKYREPGQRAGFVVAMLDWSRFQADRLLSYVMLPTGERRLVATLDYDPVDREAEVAFYTAGLQVDRTPIGREPWHVYNFDLLSLNVAFPHLVDPRGRFVVGLADPTFSDSIPLFRYRGEVELRSTGEESRNGARCRVYRIEGPGLEGRVGRIWVNEAGGYVEDIEIPVPDNPDWTSFKLRLERVTEATPLEWTSFQEVILRGGTQRSSLRQHRSDPGNAQFESAPP